jgi:hypothetical protein
MFQLNTLWRNHVVKENATAMMGSLHLLQWPSFTVAIITMMLG